MSMAMFEGVSPAALAVVAVLVWLYMRGLARRRQSARSVSKLRKAGFAAGLILWLGAFNGPLATSANQLFALHQVDHLALRLLAPFLFVLADPWPVLAAGLPGSARRRLRALADTLAPLAHVPTASALLIGWFFLWQVPAVHNAALASPVLALLAHLGMAASGVNFFVCVLDRRDGPRAHLQAPRLLAVVTVILSNILLGSVTTLKETVRYSGYDVAGRLWDVAPLVDETVGGYAIWVPSSMVMIVAMLFIFTGWNAAETRRWDSRHALIRRSNSAALEFPETARELRLRTDGPNRRIAAALATVSISIFLVVLLTVIVIVAFA